MRKYIDKHQVKTLLDEGKNYQEIADILGFSRSSIGRFCRKKFGYWPDRGYWKRRTEPIPKSEVEVLFGTLLGDACISPRAKTYYGSIVHSVKQSEYIEYLKKELPSVTNDHIVEETTTLSTGTYNKLLLCIRPNTELKGLYNMFYTNGKKDVPFDLTLLTPKAIAIWFMDDGSRIKRTGVIATCSFSVEGIKRLQLYLKEQYNIHTILRPRNYLYIKTESAKTFRSLIEPYIIPSMRYKIENMC